MSMNTYNNITLKEIQGHEFYKLLLKSIDESIPELGGINDPEGLLKCKISKDVVEIYKLLYENDFNKRLLTIIEYSNYLMQLWPCLTLESLPLMVKLDEDLSKEYNNVRRCIVMTCIWAIIEEFSSGRDDYIDLLLNITKDSCNSFECIFFNAAQLLMLESWKNDICDSSDFSDRLIVLEQRVLVRFFVICYQRIEIVSIRRCCMKLLSPSIWLHLNDDVKDHLIFDNNKLSKILYSKSINSLNHNYNDLNFNDYNHLNDVYSSTNDITVDKLNKIANFILVRDFVNSLLNHFIYILEDGINLDVFNNQTNSPPEVTTSVPLAVEASPPEVSPAVSSSNYLPVNGNATPRDRGEGSDGSSIMGMMEDGSKDVLDVTSSGSGIPVADLREAEGEVNIEGTTPSGKSSSGEAPYNGIGESNDRNGSLIDGNDSSHIQSSTGKGGNMRSDSRKRSIAGGTRSKKKKRSNDSDKDSMYMMNRIMLCENYLEFMIDLLSQLYTRRIIKPLIDVKLIYVRCAQSLLYNDDKNGMIFKGMVDILEYYINFSINEELGIPMEYNDILEAYYKKFNEFQRLCYTKYKDNDVLYNFYLLSLYELNDVERIKNMLSKVDLTLLIKLLADLHVISIEDGTRDNDGVNSSNEVTGLQENLLKLRPIQLIPMKRKKSTSVKSFFIQVLLNYLSKPVDIIDVLNKTSVYPTEEMLLSSRYIPPMDYIKLSSLSLYKLNLQYLTLFDYVYRNFKLYQLESYHQIKTSIQEAIYHTKPYSIFDDSKSNYQDLMGYNGDKLHHKSLPGADMGEGNKRDTIVNNNIDSNMGSSGVNYPNNIKNGAIMNLPTLTKFGHNYRMAIEIENINIVNINNLSNVNIEIIIDTVKVKDYQIRKEWQSLKRYDIIYMVYINKSLVNNNKYIHQYDIPEEFALDYGVISIRCGEVVNLIDEEDNIISDLNPYDIKKPIGFKIKINTLIDYKQYINDIQNDPNFYTNFNLLIRRKAKENNFKHILNNIRNNVNRKNKIPNWILQHFLGYGNPQQSLYPTLEDDCTTTTINSSVYSNLNTTDFPTSIPLSPINSGNLSGDDTLVNISGIKINYLNTWKTVRHFMDTIYSFNYKLVRFGEYNIDEYMDTELIELYKKLNNGYHLIDNNRNNYLLYYTIINNTTNDNTLAKHPLRNDLDIKPRLILLLPKFKSNVKQNNIIEGHPREVQSNSLCPAVPPEVQSTSVPLAVEASPNYSSLKSIATPGDRGGGEGSDGSSIMGMMEDGAKDVEDVTSGGSEIPESDPRELEGEVNREGSLQEEDKVVTSGGKATTASGRRVGLDLGGEVPCNGKDEFQLDPMKVKLTSTSSSFYFTSRQVECIRSGVSNGLTMIVGPPGTGKTDVICQIIGILFKNYPTEKTVICTHSNYALNDIFTKLVINKHVDEHHIVRLGSKELEIDNYGDFTKWGRVNHILQRRLDLLSIIKQFITAMNIIGDYDFNIQYALQLFESKILPFINHKKYNNTTPDVTSTVGLADSSSPLEVHPAVSSSNYLSLKGRATPGDRGEISETIYGSRGDINKKATTASGMNNSTGPQVEPAADLREAKGEVNKGSCLQDENKVGDDVEIRKDMDVTSGGENGVMTDSGDNKPHNNDNNPHNLYEIQGGEDSDVTLGGIGLPESDPRELEGQLNREGHHGEWTTSGVDDSDVTSSGEPPCNGKEVYFKLGMYDEFFALELIEYSTLNDLMLYWYDVKNNILDINNRIRFLLYLYKSLKELLPFEILRNNTDRSKYLIEKYVRLIGMTCTHAAIANELFKYDNLIIEEAGQILDIETFVPLLQLLKRFILSGDYLQLPPIIQNKSLIRYSNLYQSLLNRLIRLGTPYIILDKQGRSRPEISNLYKHFYPIYIYDINKPNYINPGFKYVYQFIDINNSNEYIPIPYFYQNLLEAEFIVSTFIYMRLIGYNNKQIVILCSYNGQKSLIEDIIKKKCSWNPNIGIPKSISTIDKFQGKQSDYILLSLVRTNKPGYLKDPRRILVALSRARLGLYIFGSWNLFNNIHQLKKFSNELIKHPLKLEILPNENMYTNRNDNHNTVIINSLNQFNHIIHNMKNK